MSPFEAGALMGAAAGLAAVWPVIVVYRWIEKRRIRRSVPVELDESYKLLSAQLKGRIP